MAFATRLGAWAIVAFVAAAGVGCQGRKEGMPKGRFEELAVGGEKVRMYVSGAGDHPPHVVVFHPWWGLNDDVIAYADRLAAAGFAVVAPDLVRGRTASTIEDAERLVQGADRGHADAV